MSYCMTEQYAERDGLGAWEAHKGHLLRVSYLHRVVTAAQYNQPSVSMLSHLESSAVHLQSLLMLAGSKVPSAKTAILRQA